MYFYKILTIYVYINYLILKIHYELIIKKFIIFIILIFILYLLNACGGKLPGADARKYPPDPEKELKKILKKAEDLDYMTYEKINGGGNFEFASSNELWRASLRYY